MRNALPAHSALASPTQAVRAERVSLSLPFSFHSALHTGSTRASLCGFSPLLSGCADNHFTSVPPLSVALISMVLILPLS